MAAVAHSCHQAKMASQLAKLCVSGPQILMKNGPGIVAGKWARNLDRTPGCCFKFEQSPVFGHETVARKWARNPDRVFGKKTHSEPPQTVTWTGLPSSARPFASSRQPDATKHTDNTTGPSMTISHHNVQIASKDAENVRCFCVRAFAKTNLTKHGAPIEQGTQSDRKNTRQLATAETQHL